MFQLSNKSVALSNEPATTISAATSTQIPMLGILGAKGGVGATTIAINIAAVLASQLNTVTLIDANLQQPDAAVLLGANPQYTMMDLLNSTGQPDQHVFAACAQAVSPELQNCLLLSPPLNGEAALKTDLSKLSHCLSNIAKFSSCWVIDLPKTLDRHLVTLMDQCRHLVLVFEATLTATTNAKRWLSTFEDLGYAKSKITCVLNRAGSKIKLVEGQLDRFFDFSKIHKIPNAYTLSEKCSTHGKPASLSYPKQAYSRSINNLALSLKEKL